MPTAIDSLLQARSTLDSFIADAANAERIDRVARMLAEAFQRGNKAMICGNGGSMADAMHFAEELTGRFRADRRALPAMACTDAGHLTCTANDYGFDQVFARWIDALGRPGDVLLVLSTSGNSPNIVNAAASGRARGMTTIALLGRGGGRLRGACDEEWVVGDEATPADRVQEVHMVVLHTLIERLELRMSGGRGS